MGRLKNTSNEKHGHLLGVTNTKISLCFHIIVYVDFAYPEDRCLDLELVFFP